MLPVYCSILVSTFGQKIACIKVYAREIGKDIQYPSGSRMRKCCRPAETFTIHYEVLIIPAVYVELFTVGMDYIAYAFPATKVERCFCYL